MKRKKIFSILSSTAIFLSLYSNTPTVNASSQTINELELQKQELNRQSNDVQDNISDREQKMQSLDSERQQLETDIATIQENIDTIMGQITEQEEEIARLEEEINQLNEEIKILKEKIAKRNIALAEQARSVQTSASASNVIDMILTAESLTEILGKMEVIGFLVNNNNTIMEDQIADRKLVEEKAEQVQLAKDETEKVRLALEVSRNNLMAQRMELDTKIQIVTENYDLTVVEREALLGQQQEIATKTSEIEQQVSEERARIAAEEKARQAREEAARQRAAAEAQRQAEAVAAAEAEAAKNNVQPATSNQSVAPAPAPAAPAPAPTNGGGWVRPSGGPVTSEYGYRIHPIFNYRKLHSGIDLGGGGAIVAAKSGTVVRASYVYGLGYSVVIDHGNGIRSSYGHMTPGLQVSSGQSVSQGQVIGTMGTTGNSTGVHLHFEIHVNGNPVNPRGYVTF